MQMEGASQPIKSQIRSSGSKTLNWEKQLRGSRGEEWVEGRGERRGPVEFLKERPLQSPI